MKDPGSQLRKALRINFKTKPKSIRNSIGNDDTVDIYRFNARSSAIDITARRLPGGKRTTVELYSTDRPLGRTLKRVGRQDFQQLSNRRRDRFLSEVDLDRSGNRRRRTYSADVEKGPHFLVVSSRSNKRTNYRLRFKASPLDPTIPDGGGDGGGGGGGDGGDGGGGGGGGGGTVNNGSGNSATSWTRQLGSADNDYGYATAVDTAGNVYIAGTTAGVLAGSSGGDQDNFVSKYDSAGQLLWTRQFNFDDSAPGNSDTVFDIEVDSAGNYYIAGATANIPDNFGSIADIEAIDADGVVAKYDSNGNQLWRRVIETATDTRTYTLLDNPGPVPDITADIHKFDAASSLALAADGTVYVGGFVEAIAEVTASLFGITRTIEQNPSQGFIAKLDGNTGAQRWLTTLGGSQSDAVTGLEVDANGQIYITGIQDTTLASINLANGGDLSSLVNDPFVGGDALVAKYEENNSQTNAQPLWTQVLASTDNRQDYSRAIALDSSNNVYITGDTTGQLPGQTATGGSDGFVAKYSTTGVQQWVRQFGTTGAEQSQAIAVDSNGKIYISGETNSNLYGPNLGEDDIWIATYDSSGTLTGSTQFGTPRAEELYRAVVDASNTVYFVGQTFGDLGGTNQGQFDVVTLRNPVV